MDELMYAVDLGYESVEEITLSNGEAVWLMIPPEGAAMGLPRYLRRVDRGLVVSTDDESMALFNEPAFLAGE